MSASQPTKQELINMIVYIKQTIPDVSQQSCKEILRILQGSGISDNKIQSKGGGTQVKFKDIPPATIVVIYNFLKEKISGKLNKLETLVAEDVEDPE